eukprot:TRINITY_DN422_c0_g1_i5.p1 TRINITY_DN422_c0_g1~~TRINITY_DN422_c0_g1_i5.p1  ORF type:complete len:462 (-),score=142.76 TRINITY_DN422_c0_g1_i5:34-1419(-)
MSNLADIKAQIEEQNNQLRAYEFETVASWPEKQQIEYYTSLLDSVKNFNLVNTASEDVSLKIEEILHDVFDAIVEQLDDPTSGEDIRQVVRKNFVKATTEKTKSLGIADAAQVKNTLNTAYAGVKKQYRPDTDYDKQQTLDSIKAELFNFVKDEKSSTSSSSEQVVEDLEQSNSSSSSSSEQVDEPEPEVEEPEQSSSSSSSEQVDEPEPVVEEPEQADELDIAEDEHVLSARMENARNEARRRIGINPRGRAADLRDESVLESYIQIRDDSHPLSWAIWGYGDSKNAISVHASGSEIDNFDAIHSNVPHEPIYIYFKYRFGDTMRAKFIFVTYVPDELGPLTKSRILGHRPAVEEFTKYQQITWHINDIEDFRESILNDKLLAAGGANYSVQDSNKGNFSQYKKNTKEFYSDKEKTGNLTDIAFDQGPLTTTPCDISGRPSVAAPSSFQGNTSNDFKASK